MAPARWLGIAIAGIAGVAAVAATQWTGMPGNGEFLVVGAMAGFVAGLAAPSRIGYAVLAGSITLAVLVPAALQGLEGLWALVIAALVIPATAGWLVGYALVRGYRLGFRAAVRDRRVLGALVTVAAFVLLIAYFAASFATSPP